ncbi:uncharacterized protein LOC124432619 [Vespa crabro]|uniref:uncharacterized protein LOC124432619 n=1 Tax=Vespa crabro TaxID=7445 RepID=UPI001F010992|nr:uncharacterized protein LOC124432619 [Vespa crabro]
MVKDPCRVPRSVLKVARKLDRVSQNPWGNSATEYGASKRVATSPPQLPDESLKKPRQEATTTEDAMWSEVANKRRSKEKPAKKATKHPQEEKKEPSKSEYRPRKRTRPDAILLKPANGKSYADVVGAIHQRFKTIAAGVDVRSVRQTRTGGVLLELKRTTADIRASFAETLRKVVGETSSITELVPRAMLVIRDCDCYTSVVEVEEALKRTLPDYTGKLDVKLTNPNARQQRLALVRLEEEAAGKLLKASRVLVGFVSCRVRQRTEHRAPNQRMLGGACNSQQEEDKMKVLQGNLNKSRTAHHLLTQLYSEKQADIVLISEQYQDRAGIGWYADKLGTAAIWIPDPRQIHVSDQGSGRGYVWVRHKSATYVSLYLTPSDWIDDFQTKLDDLEDALRERQGDLIVAGDFNAKALEWVVARPDSRGERIMELVSRLQLSVLNTGSTSTFRRPRYRETIPDVSLANEQLVAKVAGWRVIEDNTGSDHQYILFDVHDRKPAVTNPVRPPRWIIAKLDRERLSTVLNEGWRSLQIVSASLSPHAQSRRITAATMQLIEKARTIAVPKTKKKLHGRPAYWWTNEIADLCKKCLKLRRVAQRAKRRDLDAAPLAAEYQAAKKALKRAIKASQRRCWKELCLEVDQNPWGLE